MEYWGLEIPITPLLHYSITPTPQGGGAFHT